MSTIPSQKATERNIEQSSAEEEMKTQEIKSRRTMRKPAHVYVVVPNDEMDKWFESLPLKDEAGMTIVDLKFMTGNGEEVMFTPTNWSEDSVLFHVHKLEPFTEVG